MIKKESKNALAAEATLAEILEGLAAIEAQWSKQQAKPLASGTQPPTVPSSQQTPYSPKDIIGIGLGVLSTCDEAEISATLIGMKTEELTPLYRGYRFPAEMISHGVWLYVRFSFSFRDIEESMAERGVGLTYETIRQWCLKCGQTYANELKRRRPKTGDTWHLDVRVPENQRQNLLFVESC